MSIKKNACNKGISMIEIIIAGLISTVIIGSCINIWSFGYKNWALERMRSKLRINLEMALENIKSELRLSNTQYLSLYKSSGMSEYKAISFPVPTLNSNGFASLESNGMIYWDKSVIYHVYGTSPNLELRRTEFTNNHNYLVDTTQRELQLQYVYMDGNGNGEDTPNNNKAETKTIFTNLVDLTIAPLIAEFDGYNSSLTRSESVSMGSIKLTPGDHLFKFYVTDKNANSSGYEFGIDSLAITPSGSTREVEIYAPTATGGASHPTEYAFGWGGNNYHQYNAGAVDDFMTLTIYNDEYIESNFSRTIRSNTVLTSGTNGYDNNPYVQLASADSNSQFLWMASGQTGVAAVNYPQGAIGDVLPSSDDFLIRTVIKGTTPNDFIDLLTNQKKLRIKFSAHSLDSLNIVSAYLVKRSTISEEDGTGAVYQLTFNSGNAGVVIPANTDIWTDWLTLIAENNVDYLVTMRVTVVSNNKKFKYWDPNDAAATNSYFSVSSDNSAAAVDWDSTKCIATPYIFSIEAIEQWANEGTLISVIYDTNINSVTDPNYDTICWDQNSGDGSITVEMRAGDQSDLSDATSWTSVTNGGMVPSGCDGKRYMQFRVTMASNDPYVFLPWIDNVRIKWPGETRICDISCYYTKNTDYGIISLKVDDLDPTKGLSFKVTVYDVFQGVTYSASSTAQVEPRNSGL